MKSIGFALLGVIAFTATSVFAQEKTDTFKVFGNCGMCKKRIEKAAMSEGVSAAVWDVDSKIITITYDIAKTSNDEIQKQIAAVGHDTDKYTADDKVYKKLPGCCLYERRKKDSKDDHTGDH